MSITALDAFAAYQAADAVWQANLVAAFGADAGDARYQVRGSMVEGFTEYCAARVAWDYAYQCERAERNSRQREHEEALERERWDG